MLVTGENRPREGSYFQSTVRIPESEQSRYSMAMIRQGEAQARAEKHVLTFADPECRCRDGFHWKCGIHKTWVN